MKIIAIRADASVKIGTGHVMRCLVLAEQIRRAVSDVQIVFLCVQKQGHLIAHIQDRGYQVVEMAEYDDFVTMEQLASHLPVALSDPMSVSMVDLSTPIDLLIVDHYQLDAKWERSMRGLAKKLLVIDDLANRRHDCDALLDQNYNKDMEQRYAAWVLDSCRCFIGPRHLLLRSEFLQVRETLEHRKRYRSSSKGHRAFTRDCEDYQQGQVESVLIFYGGSDPTGETVKALQAVSLWKSRLSGRGSGRNICIHVIVGASNPAFADITAYCNSIKGVSEDVKIYRHVDNIADMLGKTDVVLGAGGVSMWERCYLGVPSIVTVVAENQRTTTEYAAEYGAVCNAGWYGDVTAESLAMLLERFDQNVDARSRMSERAVQMMNEGIGEQRLIDWISGTLR